MSGNCFCFAKCPHATGSGKAQTCEPKDQNKTIERPETYYMAETRMSSWNQIVCLSRTGFFDQDKIICAEHNCIVSCTVWLNAEYLSSRNRIVLNQILWLELDFLVGSRFLGLKQIVLVEFYCQPGTRLSEHSPGQNQIALPELAWLMAQSNHIAYHY